MQGGLLWTPLLAVAIAVFAAEIPFFFLGTPSGHDVEFHLYSWLEVLAQWKQGIFYPGWAPMAHFGFGEPRFIFYPPASWTLGALVSAVFPWAIASAVYIWIVLTAAGASMFTLARRWLDRRDAIFAAVLYAVNPYHLVIVYWRSAFAEMLAACLVPLLLLYILRAADAQRWRSMIPLGVILAAAWLTNAPAAIMMHYSFALLMAFLAWKKRSLPLVIIAVGAVALGALLSAFYLWPAIYEQKWINIAESVSAGSRPQDNFLFIHTSDADHDKFNRIISSIAILEMIVIAGIAVLSKLWRQKAEAPVLLVWGVACSIVMFPVASFGWKILPKMQFMQFPWRWLLCLSMILTLAVVFCVRRWVWRAAIYAAFLLVIAAGWHYLQPPWWDNAADLKEMQDNLKDHIGYEGTDEYTPKGAEPANIEKDARNVTVAGPSRAAIKVLRWDVEEKVFTADLSAPDQLALRLFPYPAWRVKVNGQIVQTSPRESSGQVLVPVQAGLNRVEIVFTRTWDRSLGAWVSVVTLLSTMAWSFSRRRSPLSR